MVLSLMSSLRHFNCPSSVKIECDQSLHVNAQNEKAIPCEKDFQQCESLKCCFEELDGSSIGSATRSLAKLALDEGNFPDSRRLRGKEVAIGNFRKKDFDFQHNGQAVSNKKNSSKDKLKEVGLNIGLRPSSKESILHFSKEPSKHLHFGASRDLQARDMSDKVGLKPMAQLNPNVAGKDLTARVESTPATHDQNEILVEVECLDFGKHSAVVFPENKNLSTNSSDHSLKSIVGSSIMTLSGMEKGMRNKKSGITKKTKQNLPW
ncbi:hypothetical protein GOBAR_AA34506 [Gossypium barbadense]|uniref:Uncharacterized protein n=1 Tax=Gossypium barbadense TaxID=3634 RepID=A0A2P5W501_GOSBA|nr:hypothetical protein GOBAR_AA34506 [Gossypium barbadense]